MEQRKDYVEIQIEMLTNALKRLLDKIRKVKLEGEVLSELVCVIDNLSLGDVLKIADKFLIKKLTEKHKVTNSQIKILADILFEYMHIKSTDKNICNKAKILYKHYHENEIKTIDFITFSRLKELEERINEAK